MLREEALCYYKDNREYELLGRIQLRDIERVVQVQNHPRENVMALITKRRTYYLQADDVHLWASCLAAVATDLHHQPLVPQTIDVSEMPVDASDMPGEEMDLQEAPDGSSSEHSLHDLFGLDDHRPLLAGHVLKLSGKVSRTFRSRWAVLRPRQLAVYKDEREYELSRLYDTSQLLHVLKLDPLPQHPHVFKIVCRKRGLVFSVETEQELTQWMDTLQKCLSS